MFDSRCNNASLVMRGVRGSNAHGYHRLNQEQRGENVSNYREHQCRNEYGYHRGLEISKPISAEKKNNRLVRPKL